MNGRLHPDRALLACSVTLLLGGCISPAGIDTKARLVDPARLATGTVAAAPELSAAAWPATDWWRALGDPQLDALIAEAQAGNPGIGQAQARLDAASAAVTLAGARLGLANEIDAGVTRQRFTRFGTSVNFAGRSFTQYDLAAAFGFQPDFWERNRSALAGELGRRKAAEAESQAVRLLLAASVAAAYARLGSELEQQSLLRAALQHQQALVGHLQARQEAGFDTAGEWQLAQAVLPELQARIAILEQDSALSRNQLAALLGQGPERGRRIAPPRLAPLTVGVPEVLPADLLGQRADIVASRWRVEAAGHDVASARAGFYPNINIAAYVGLQSIGLGNLLRSGSQVFGLAPAVSLPIFGGSTLKGTLAARNAGYDLAVEQYNQQVIEALRQVADQVEILRGLQRQLSEASASLAREEQARQLAAARFEGGLDNRLALLSLEARIETRRLQMAQLRGRLREAGIQLVVALGGGYAPADTAPASAATTGTSATSGDAS